MDPNIIQANGFGLMLGGSSESFPKLGVSSLGGVPIRRTIVFWDLYWGPLFWKFLP